MEAFRGGAARLELVRDLERGGLTPPLALVRAIQERVPLPLRVMVRESESFTVADPAEIDRLCRSVRELEALGVEGIVLGFSRDGTADVALLGRVLSAAPSLEATFHRAFEVVADPFETLGRLKRFPQIDHVLTRGGDGGWRQCAPRLEALRRAAFPEITILPGGGVDGLAIRVLAASTGLREFHVGAAARVPATLSGAVRAARVRELVEFCESPASAAPRPARAPRGR